ncbi:hypothetical protein K470DRAFT_118919 [Piedraia hortae CBS 480.64]|uniref:Pal1-domain-containing protein n=1 Tax=Piedraia hortae CBS 480.64 TaxID=1314780 RepID=A0A6A7BU68_9PEZI|nr:hypothetical protein K470DRAFT_118919 [Piedraia hortae CBS 480.64]
MASDPAKTVAASDDPVQTSANPQGERLPPPPYATNPAAGIPQRGNSLSERYPGDKSVQPLDVIRKDSRKAQRAPHLTKAQLPGPDTIDRLDPAIGGIPYHHEGPFDAATLGRNVDPKTSPLAALETSNQEALKATPAEKIRDAVEGHRPLEGVAAVPPGVPDQFGRTYDYEEGTDLMREGGPNDAGYKRWPGKAYDDEDLKGKSEPAFGLDRALKSHTVGEDSIDIEDRAHLNKDYHQAEQSGKLDQRDPVKIAGDDGKYADMELANAASHETSHEAPDASGRSGGLREGIKKRIGSLRRKHND